MSDTATTPLEGATFDLRIEFDDGRPARVVPYRPGKVKLKTLKAIERFDALPDDKKNWAELTATIATVLGIPEDEADEIELAQWVALGNLIRNAGAIPNESAPPTG